MQDTFNNEVDHFSDENHVDKDSEDDQWEISWNTNQDFHENHNSDSNENSNRVEVSFDTEISKECF